jgi:tetratricopeptide (TPR) repeat protein
MNNAMRLIVVAGAAATLGGCATSPLTSWMFKDKRPVAAEGEALAGNTAGALEEGRAHLQDGNISAAVASFRIAQLDRGSRAEASNGLGIAYARLGRDDIAEQYFQAAIAVEPDNTKFVANLLRLQQAGLARRAASRDAQLAAAAPLEAAQAQPLAAAAEAPSLLTGPAYRLSRNEVRVSARAEPGRAPAIRVGYRQEPAPVAEERSTEQTVAAAEPARSVPVAQVSQVRQVDNPFARTER